MDQVSINYVLVTHIYYYGYRREVVILSDWTHIYNTYIGAIH
jgi:hypothetical protein